MASKNLWGNLPLGDEAGKSPKAILDEQVKFLTEGSQHNLRGKVTTRQNDFGQIEHQLTIIAPYLNNYEVGIVVATHRAETYPVRVEELVESGIRPVDCQTDQDFEAALEKVLTSKKVRSIISSLLSQSPNRPAPPTGLTIT